MSTDQTHEEVFGTPKTKGDSSSATCSPGKRPLTQGIFKSHPPEVVVAAVDYDGTLKFGDATHIRYTWASECWRGCKWISKVHGTDFEPLTSIQRENDQALPQSERPKL